MKEIRFVPLPAAVFGIVMMASFPAAAAPDEVFADFDSGGFGDWTVSGEAFGEAPASETRPNQQAVTGFEGAGYVNSYFGGDDARGRLTSPDFRINRRFISFLVGGGAGEGREIRLVVDGRVVRKSSGSNDEQLALQGWDVNDLRGKNARLEIVDDAAGSWGHINVDQIVFTDRAVPMEKTDATKDFAIDGPWLNFPVKDGGPRRVVTVRADGKEVRRFDIELADGSPDWWASLDVRAWQGGRLTVAVDRLAPESRALEGIAVGTRPEPADLYREKHRPQFHFSARRGWINDPNGLVFYGGEYHLFFQHNPYGREWGNMHWGHAVSSDLVRWREIGEALYPDQHGTMFSGSAVVDWNNTSGFGKDEKPPLVLFYTAAGEPFTQGLAYSTDGRSFSKYEGNPIIENFSKGNRDPKVCWHEPTKKWVMTFWGEEKGRHVLYFLTSPDLKRWTRVSELSGSPLGGGSFLFECPDFFELPVDGKPDQKKWVVFGANGEYGLGSFDGRRFTLEGDRQRAQGSDHVYAAQTYSDEPKGRRVWVGWFRAPSPGMPFNQTMTIPLELRLADTPDGIRLTYLPVEELKSLRGPSHEPAPFVLKEGESKNLSGISRDTLEIRAKFKPEASATVTLNARGIPIIYDVATQELTVNGVKNKAPLRNGRMDLTVFVDRTTVEVIASGGEVFVPIAAIAPAETGVSISCQGGSADFSKFTVYELKSAWAASRP